MLTITVVTDDDNFIPDMSGDNSHSVPDRNDPRIHWEPLSESARYLTVTLLTVINE